MLHIQPNRSTWGNIYGPIAPHLEPVITLLDRLLRPWELVELQVIDLDGGSGRELLVANGFFNDPIQLGIAAMQYEKKPVNIQFVINPIMTHILNVWPVNQLENRCRATASNGDVLRRSTLIVRFISKRDSLGQISGRQVSLAVSRAKTCRDFLSAQGWPDAALANEGGSIDLIYAIDLPNSGLYRTLIQQGLQVLACTFNDALVTVDTTFVAAAQRQSLYGVRTDLPIYPSSLVEDVPEFLEPVRVQLLTALAAKLPSMSQPQAITEISDDESAADEVAAGNDDQATPSDDQAGGDAYGLHAFVTEECTLDEQVWIPTNRLYEEYVAFCDLYGFTAVSVASFGKMITARFDLFPERHRVAGVTVRGVRGIRLGHS